jgi:hypothetical protein
MFRMPDPVALVTLEEEKGEEAHGSQRLFDQVVFQQHFEDMLFLLKGSSPTMLRLIVHQNVNIDIPSTFTQVSPFAFADLE